MKILQVINRLGTGGAEKLIVEIVPLFQQKGYATDVLCLSKKQTDFWDELKSKSKGSVSGLTDNSMYNPILIFKIVSYLRKYDIVNVHLFPSLYWVVIAKLISFSNIKIVYTEHNTSNRRRHRKIFKILDRFIYKKLDKIITIADEVDYNIKNHLKIPNSKFQLINNGVNVDVYSNALPYNKEDFFDSSDIILIQISSFREQKDQPTLIKSLQYLPGNVKLLLVGDGHLRVNCELLVADNNLQDRVKFLGNRYDVPRLLKTSDIVVLSSHHEGLSLSNIEGMSVNKPFVGSNVQGIREIVKGHGLLFEENNEKDLAQQITSLLSDKDYFQSVADKCLKRAQEFDINRMVNSYIETYKSLFE